VIGSMIAQSLSGTAAPEKWLVDWVTQGSRTSSGERINESTALTCAAVYAANRVLAETMATLPPSIFRHLPGGGHAPAPDHPVHRILHDEPNPECSSFIWRETLQGHLGTWGNGYAEIQRAFNQMPVSLWQRSPKPHHTRPKRRDDVDGKIWYQCRSDAGEESWIKAENMFHVPGFGFDGLVGYSPISLMREPIGVNKAAERYAGELFANDARPNGYLTIPEGLSEDAYERTKKGFNESGSEHGSRHKTHLLEGGATFAASQMNPEDVQMIEARRFGIEEIARAYRIAPPLLQDLTHGTFSNITELGRQFIVYTMMPWIKRWEHEINRKLLTPEFFCKFNTYAFMQGDPEKEALYLTKQFMMGVVTINDVLELHDQNPIGPEGDVRFVPRNLMPLEQAIAEPPEPEPVPTPEDPDESEEPDEPEDEKDAPPEKEQEEQRANQTAVLLEAARDEGNKSSERTAGVHARFDQLEQMLAATDKRDEERHRTLLGERELLFEVLSAAVNDALAEQGDEQRNMFAKILKAVRPMEGGLTALKSVIVGLKGDRDRLLECGQRAWEITTGELFRKEAKVAAQHASKGGNFLASMDDFYDKHHALCVTKFEVASLLLGIPAVDFAREHIKQSQETLLIAAECKASELPERIAQCVAQWAEDRKPISGDNQDGNSNEN